MPQPKEKVENYIMDAFKDTIVLESIAKALALYIEKYVEQCVEKKLVPLMKEICDLKLDNTRLTIESEAARQEVADCRKQLEQQLDRIEDVDAYVKSDHLIIKGLAESSYAERATAGGDYATGGSQTQSHLAVESTILNFCNEVLQVKVSPTDISVAHRLKAGPRDKVRPIIVRFTSRRVRHEVYSARKTLRGSSSPIYIQEQLTKGASSLFFEARKLVREKQITSAWTHNGQVLVKFSADPSARPVSIKRLSDLHAQPSASTVRR